MFKWIIFVILMLNASSVFGTAQEPDILFIEGEKYYLRSNPLEPYFQMTGKPKFNEKPMKTTSEGSFIEGISSSSNWRGYVATWELENDTLYLREIKNLWEISVDLSTIFKDRDTSQKIKADWFNGELRIPEGELLKYVHMGYGSVYERDIIYTIKSGQVTNKRVVDNTQKNLPSEYDIVIEELNKAQAEGVLK